MSWIGKPFLLWSTAGQNFFVGFCFPTKESFCYAFDIYCKSVCRFHDRLSMSSSSFFRSRRSFHKLFLESRISEFQIDKPEKCNCFPRDQKGTQGYWGQLPPCLLRLKMRFALMNDKDLWPKTVTIQLTLAIYNHKIFWRNKKQVRKTEFHTWKNNITSLLQILVNKILLFKYCNLDHA